MLNRVSLALHSINLSQGVERFSSYSGYGKTFEFTGDFKDESKVSENVCSYSFTYHVTAHAQDLSSIVIKGFRKVAPIRICLLRICLGFRGA